MTGQANTHGPDLEAMVLDDLSSAAPVQNKMDDAFGHAHAVTNDKGQVDVAATIEHLIHQSHEVVGETIPAAKADHTYFPGYDALSSTFKSIKNGIENGHYTSRLKNALLNVYESVVQDVSTNKALARIQAAPINAAKRVATKLAEMSGDDYLVPLINEADSVNQVASYARRSLQTIYGKAKERFTYTGSPALQPAYAGAPAQGAPGHK